MIGNTVQPRRVLVAVGEIVKYVLTIGLSGFLLLLVAKIRSDSGNATVQIENVQGELSAMRGQMREYESQIESQEVRIDRLHRKLGAIQQELRVQNQGSADRQSISRSGAERNQQSSGAPRSVRIQGRRGDRTMKPNAVNEHSGRK